MEPAEEAKASPLATSIRAPEVNMIKTSAAPVAAVASASGPPPATAAATKPNDDDADKGDDAAKSDSDANDPHSRERFGRKGRKHRYRGVYMCGKKWKVQIQFAGKQRYLGSYADQRTAALVYDDAARRLHGAAAITNFDLPKPSLAVRRATSPAAPGNAGYVPHGSGLPPPPGGSLGATGALASHGPRPYYPPHPSTLARQQQGAGADATMSPGSHKSALDTLCLVASAAPPSPYRAQAAQNAVASRLPVEPVPSNPFLAPRYESPYGSRAEMDARAHAAAYADAQARVVAERDERARFHAKLQADAEAALQYQQRHMPSNATDAGRQLPPSHPYSFSPGSLGASMASNGPMAGWSPLTPMSNHLVGDRLTPSVSPRSLSGHSADGEHASLALPPGVSPSSYYGNSKAPQRFEYSPHQLSLYPGVAPLPSQSSGAAALQPQGFSPLLSKDDGMLRANLPPGVSPFSGMPQHGQWPLPFPGASAPRGMPSHGAGWAPPGSAYLQNGGQAAHATHGKDVAAGKPPRFNVPDPGVYSTSYLEFRRKRKPEDIEPAERGAKRSIPPQGMSQPHPSFLGGETGWKHLG